MKVDKSIDVVDTCCPIPLIKLAEAMKTLMPGQNLQITGNDPIFERGLRDYCQARGHTIMDIKIEKNAVTVVIQK